MPVRMVLFRDTEGESLCMNLHIEEVDVLFKSNNVKVLQIPCYA